MDLVAQTAGEVFTKRNLERAIEGAFARAALRLFFLLALAAGFSTRAAAQSSVVFSLDFPNSSPEHYSISVQSDGHAHYESSGKITQESDERDSYQTDFIVSDATRARIFDLAAQAHYFEGKIDSGKKKIAFTGAKKLAYKDGTHNIAAEYNYSPVVEVQQLTSIFQNVGGTMEYGRRLVYFHRYQKLALDDELKRMEDQARRGEIAELQAVSPVLRDIYEDNSVINVVRARAHRIMDMDHAEAAAK
jgi:hypothetical protein